LETQTEKDMPKKIDCVLPLHHKDFDRFELLRLSMQKFWMIEGTVRVVTPAADCQAAMELIGDDGRFAVLPETELLPELESSTAAGWWKQQAIKLAFHRFTDAEFYLTLDADCVAVRPIRYEDLVSDGRGLMQYESLETHEDWYAFSSIVLDMPFPSGEAVCATPFLLATENVANLCRHLQQHLAANWSSVFLQPPFGPTEYTLYHIFTSEADRWADRHLASNDAVKFQMFGNCIWNDRDQTNWNAADSFRDPDFLFSVLQSNTSIPFQWIRQRVLPFLELANAE
jgi:hypothetical protein